jgi:hypothetical protein
MQPSSRLQSRALHPPSMAMHQPFSAQSMLRAQSASVAATQPASVSAQRPSKRQMKLSWQDFAHSPDELRGRRTSLQLPADVHASERSQSALATASQRSVPLQRPNFRQAGESRQDVPTLVHRPPFAAHSRLDAHNRLLSQSSSTPTAHAPSTGEQRPSDEHTEMLWQSSPLGTHFPSRAVQRPWTLQTVERRQSSSVTTPHLPSFAEHQPSTRQLESSRQAASVATHAPPTRLHLPSDAQKSAAAQSACARATHAPASAVQIPCTRQARDCRQSSFAPATHEPSSASVHAPDAAQFADALQAVLSAVTSAARLQIRAKHSSLSPQGRSSPHASPSPARQASSETRQARAMALRRTDNVAPLPGAAR